MKPMISRGDLRAKVLMVAEEHGERRSAARHVQGIDRLFKEVFVIDNGRVLEVVMRLVLGDRKREIEKAFRSEPVKEHVLTYLTAVYREYHHRLWDECKARAAARRHERALTSCPTRCTVGRN